MIFILGVERSATTWIANILDHHPLTEVFMEPLSGFNSRFQEWPDRFEKLDNPDTSAGYFKMEFDALRGHRRFLFTRISDSAIAWRYDLKLAAFLIKKKRANASITDFHELNFHRKNRQIIIKKQSRLQTVIKEVRLNFNAQVLPRLDSQIKVLVPIREMASCVRSILQQIEQANLVDLENALIHHYGKINPQVVCKYWFKSYDTLINSLENNGILYRIVSHTDLLQQPDKTVRKFLDFLDLESTPEITAFIERSNEPGRGKHTTTRSREKLLEQRIEDRIQIYPMVEEELDRIHEHTVLKKFAE